MEVAPRYKLLTLLILLTLLTRPWVFRGFMGPMGTWTVACLPLLHIPGVTFSSKVDICKLVMFCHKYLIGRRVLFLNLMQRPEKMFQNVTFVIFSLKNVNKNAQIGQNRPIFAFFVQKRATAWKKYTTASGRDGDKYQLWANANEILNTSSFKHCSSYFISFYRKYNLFKGKSFTFKVYLFHSKIISSLSCSFNVPFSFSWHKFVRTKCRNSSAPHILCQLLTTVPPLLSPFSSSCRSIYCCSCELKGQIHNIKSNNIDNLWLRENMVLPKSSAMILSKWDWKLGDLAIVRSFQALPSSRI